MRKINKEQHKLRRTMLINLIETYPEAIELNVSKLARIAKVSHTEYQKMNRTWNDIRKDIKFEMKSSN